MPGKLQFSMHHSYLQYAVYKRQIQSPHRGKFVVGKLGTLVVGKLGKFVVGNLGKLVVRLFVLLLTSHTTAMVIAGRSLHLTTHFSRAKLTSISCTYFRF